jgi:glycosyltransferase involved in cell wall biosynthesis
LIDRLKLWNWSVKNTNSEFTKAVIEKAWQTKVQFVHYPMILPGIAKLSTEYLAQKKPYILNVGRFFRQLHCKHQEVLIAAFKQLLNDQPKLIKSWELICLGSIEDQAYADQLHQLAKGWPIKFIHQASRSELLNIIRG